VTLIVFDVDHFKKYNDALGHPGGDECLRAIAAVASRCVRGEGDVLARYGGEEFALILPGASLDVGRAIAERVRRSVVDRAIPHPSVPPPGVVTISLGVATLTPPAGTPQLLIEAADRCLYVAKRNGRDRVVGDADEAARTPAPFSPIPLAPASSS
jgi:two-component system chemotaxis family response regulator WspR